MYKAFLLLLLITEQWIVILYTAILFLRQNDLRSNVSRRNGCAGKVLSSFTSGWQKPRFSRKDTMVHSTQLLQKSNQIPVKANFSDIFVFEKYLPPNLTDPPLLPSYLYIILVYDLLLYNKLIISFMVG